MEAKLSSFYHSELGRGEQSSTHKESRSPAFIRRLRRLSVDGACRAGAEVACPRGLR